MDPYLIILKKLKAMTACL